MSERKDTANPWLLPLLSRVATGAVHGFYQFRIEGESPPADGAALFVGNHPNSLMDPAFVAAAAGRPVRFLAKAPLFTDRMVGWLIRASGSIPVYRRQDDPELVGRNRSVFEAVHEALRDGSAVGIFPEGISHSQPSLAELRTGAARICLGAASSHGLYFPIVPIGMILREKERFRSEAYALVGAPVDWEDLRDRSEDDVDAVRELTGRIDAALREVTLNVERWEDLPILECAEAIYTAELELDNEPGDRVRRIRQMSETLTGLRMSDSAQVDRLYDAVGTFLRAITALGVSPSQLDSDPRRPISGWAVRRLTLFLVGGPVAGAGFVLFFPPYRLTGLIGEKQSLDQDVRATWKAMGGAVFYVAWILILTILVALLFGWPWGVTAIAALPLLALLTFYVRDSWVEAKADVRHYLSLRRRKNVWGWLLEERSVLAESLEMIRQARPD
jgi:1-acyl-sn-glycerol-3-phosphate acyltransferase